MILTDVTDRIGTITLNRPERRNALNPELIGALDDGRARRWPSDDDVKVVILTGAAPEGRLGGFCSGGDTKESGATRGKPGSDPRSLLGVPRDALTGDLARHDDHAAMRLHLMPKPTIAMVGGPAVGAGCSLAAACDFRFASDDAVFASSFSANGISGDYGGIVLLDADHRDGPHPRAVLPQRQDPGGASARRSAWCTPSSPPPSCATTRWMSPAGCSARRPRCSRW